jgi:hypothetical protein
MNKHSIHAGQSPELLLFFFSGGLLSTRLETAEEQNVPLFCGAPNARLDTLEMTIIDQTALLGNILWKLPQVDLQLVEFPKANYVGHI